MEILPISGGIGVAIVLYCFFLLLGLLIISYLLLKKKEGFNLTWERDEENNLNFGWIVTVKITTEDIKEYGPVLICALKKILRDYRIIGIDGGNLRLLVRSFFAQPEGENYTLLWDGEDRLNTDTTVTVEVKNQEKEYGLSYLRALKEITKHHRIISIKGGSIQFFVEPLIPSPSDWAALGLTSRIS